MADAAELARNYAAFVEEVIAGGRLAREARWTESIAVGNREFVEGVAGEIEGRVKLDIDKDGEDTKYSRKASPGISSTARMSTAETAPDNAARRKQDSRPARLPQMRITTVRTPPPAQHVLQRSKRTNTNRCSALGSSELGSIGCHFGIVRHFDQDRALTNAVARGTLYT
jgi:hypothetical protein